MSQRLDGEESWDKRIEKRYMCNPQSGPSVDCAGPTKLTPVCPRPCPAQPALLFGSTTKVGRGRTSMRATRETATSSRTPSRLRRARSRSATDGPIRTPSILTKRHLLKAAAGTENTRFVGSLFHRTPLVIFKRRPLRLLFAPQHTLALDPGPSPKQGY